MSFHPRSHPYRKIASIAAVLFAATRFSASAVPAAKPAGPQAIPFTIGHADCAGEGGFRFNINDALLGTARSSQGCACNDAPLVVTFADPRSVAWFHPAARSRFRIDITQGKSLALGFVRVAVGTDSGKRSLCLFDGGTDGIRTGNARDRDVAPRSTNPLPELDGTVSVPKRGTQVPLAPLVFRTSDSPFDAGVNNQGWWSATLANNDHNDNYLIGNTLISIGAPEVRSFFTFDLSSLDLTGASIVSALLQVDRGNSGADSTETFALFDVSTDSATLNDNMGTSQAIFDDLGTGTAYGSYTVRVVGAQYGRASYRLNTAAIVGITEAAGGYFSIGGSLRSLPGFVFGGTGGGDQRLVLCLDSDLDTDGDGVCDAVDNCPTTANPEQEDVSGNEVGDACDDLDEDGILDVTDNCPFDVNADQLDGDGDGVGDVCDNCVEVSNPDQADADDDGVGDACAQCPPDEDPDGDNVCNGVDNCPASQNADQADGDGDGWGDACDSCAGPGQLDCDGDTVCDQADNCLCSSNPDQADTDGDGVGDVCDQCLGPGSSDFDGDGICDPLDNCGFNGNPDQAESDGDGIGDVCDNCPSVPNPNQADDDSNGVGDACAHCELYTDHDGDDVCDDFDNCPAASNADQADADEDGFGNACDVCFGWGGADSDLDGLCDPLDDCPFVSDPGQSDSDGDGHGDVCDNCPAVFNVNQADSDGDAFGDCCDPCPDDPGDVCGLGASDAMGDGQGSRVGIGSCGPEIRAPGSRPRD